METFTLACMMLLQLNLFDFTDFCPNVHRIKKKSNLDLIFTSVQNKFIDTKVEVPDLK